MEEELKNGMMIDKTMEADLLSAAKWAKFLLIIGCLGWLFLVVMGVALIAFGNKCGFLMGAPCPPEGCPAPGVDGACPAPPACVGIFVGIVYLVCALIMIYPLVKGFQFANCTKAACLTGSEAKLSRGFAGLRGYLKFTGIVTIIVLVIYAIIGILAAVGFAAMKCGA